MALLLRTPEGARRAVFMHLQKTGGTWVRAVLSEAGLGAGEIGQKHTQFAKVREREPEAFVFGFVREPFDFLRSYFLHRQRHGHWVDRDFDNACKASTLERFFDKYLARRPGWVGDWYDLYVGEADYVGRTEHLRAHLGVVLGKIGVSYDPELLQRVGPQNVTPAATPRVSGLGGREKHYRQAVREAESRAYERWYPQL